MTTVTIPPFTLPEDLAEKAKAKGLLSPDSIANLVSEAVVRDEIRLKEEGVVYPADFDPRLKGFVNPALYRKGKVLGDIIGPFHEEWGETP